jgi:hypothetical protein
LDVHQDECCFHDACLSFFFFFHHEGHEEHEDDIIFMPFGVFAVGSGASTYYPCS